MNPIDFNLKAKSFKIKGLNMLGNSPESKKFISYNNEERKNYYKNVIPKPIEVNYSSLIFNRAQTYTKRIQVMC
jgi:hypothetical protein